MKVQIVILVHVHFFLILINAEQQFVYVERQFRTQSQSLFNDDYDKHTAPPKLVEGKKYSIPKLSSPLQNMSNFRMTRFEALYDLGNTLLFCWREIEFYLGVVGI